MPTFTFRNPFHTLTPRAAVATLAICSLAAPAVCTAGDLTVALTPRAIELLDRARENPVPLFEVLDAGFQFVERDGGPFESGQAVRTGLVMIERGRVTEAAFGEAYPAGGASPPQSKYPCGLPFMPPEELVTVRAVEGGLEEVSAPIFASDDGLRNLDVGSLRLIRDARVDWDNESVVLLVIAPAERGSSAGAQGLVMVCKWVDNA
jgi:hypothetical protein